MNALSLIFHTMLDDVTVEYFVRLGLACIFGASFGLERQLRGKPFGIRTCMLITVGTALFVFLGVKVQVGSSDPARVLGQVITGIGFLGAGSIMKQDGLVSGITSAATVWIIAGIGAALGFGFYGIALVTTLSGLFTVTMSRLIERSVNSLRGGVHKE